MVGFASGAIVGVAPVALSSQSQCSLTGGSRGGEGRVSLSLSIQKRGDKTQSYVT